MATVEHVWAESLFELAAEGNTLDETDKELSGITTILEGAPEYIELLSSPTLSKDEKTEAIKKVFDGKISKTLENFLCLLAQKGRMHYLFKIKEEWKIRFFAAKGIAEAEVTSAVKLTDKQKSALEAKLSKKYGKKIILREKVDPAIIGGLSVKVGDELSDGTIRTKFDNIASSIKSVTA
ncbi:MAG: F0F1 ATP synthase subunit delta [Ruminococcus sp.]|jgi:F-type H+-transporting ATPase subunit delta|nr:F0F1 ATP synthase subunit delta [Ruminococcus sp.]